MTKARYGRVCVHLYEVIILRDICIIGDYDSVCGYGALGIKVYAVSDNGKALDILKNAVETAKIILVTEPIAEALQSEIDLLKDRKLPAVIPVPSLTGSSGFAKKRISKAVKQAVGSDISFGE